MVELAPAKPLSRGSASRQVRVAAVADLHIRADDRARTIPGMHEVDQQADLLVVAGDLTENGRLAEADAVAELLARCRVPVVAVLGNHDLRNLRRKAFRQSLERRGIAVLAGEGTALTLPNGIRVGIAGATGCGGGFWPIEGPAVIPNRSVRSLAIRSRRELWSLENALTALSTDVTIAVTHFAPTASTLGREPHAKYWMLGNCELGALFDRTAPHLVLHGHAHLGTLAGRTPGGLHVRNVALPVVRSIHVEVLEQQPGGAVRLAGLAPSVTCETRALATRRWAR